jgi:hypothetical protein
VWAPPSQQMSALAEVIARGTPFTPEVVAKWLGVRGIGSLAEVPQDLLYEFLVRGIGAAPRDIQAFIQTLRVMDGPSVADDPLGLSGGFMDMRRVVRHKLRFSLPFSMGAYHDPGSPFFHIGHPENPVSHKHGGWFPCDCWKCS